jgi:hypothetical protein
MTFDPDNPPIPPDAVFVPWGAIVALRIEWHRNRRTGISVRPWRGVRDEFIAAYLAERERAARSGGHERAPDQFRPVFDK